CEQIHEIQKNKDTPVVFVTVQADFKTRTETSLVGGADIMIKPFLMFEITVKAIMLAMVKRLQLAASSEREVSVKLALTDTGKSGSEKVTAEKNAPAKTSEKPAREKATPEKTVEKATATKGVAEKPVEKPETPATEKTAPLPVAASEPAPTEVAA